MSLETAIQQLRRLHSPVPKPMRLPTPEEVSETEHQLGVHFHPDYRRYLLEASDVVFGSLEPATIMRSGRFQNLPAICRTAWEKWGVPRTLLPICEDNADFYCMNDAGEIVFWSHNGPENEKWRDLASWIEAVWIGESS